MNPPDANGPVEVCVNNPADWELIYKNPDLHVKCPVESCDTLLTAKYIKLTGRRFFAVRPGSIDCHHSQADRSIGRGDIKQEQPEPNRGGGPEGDEHQWIKKRLFSIAKKKLDSGAVLEHQPTKADIFLPNHNLAIEYQRWDTDFRTRTRQRESAGAARTIWLFPSVLPERAPSTLHKTFDREVFQRGGLYVDVLNRNDTKERQRPWEDASQNHTAHLYVRGPIAKYDDDKKELVYTTLSMVTFLKQVISGERALKMAPVTNRHNHKRTRLVWILLNDLARVIEPAKNEHQHTTSSADITTPQMHLYPLSPLESQSENTAAEKETSTPSPGHTPTPAESSPHTPCPPAAIHTGPHYRRTTDTISFLNDAPLTRQHPISPWKRVVSWIRRRVIKYE